MAITKRDIDNVSLKVVQEGYDPEEVDLLLERIAEEVDAFNHALVEAASRVEMAEARARAAEQQAAQSALMAQSSQSSQQTAASERQIAQALIAAQKSADELREAAKIESENAYHEGEKRARDIVRDALSEKQRILDEIDRLRVSTEKFRSEYMAVLSRFTSEAQKEMPKLEEAKPSVDAEIKATAEALQTIKEGDAAFEAPKSERVAPTPELFDSAAGQTATASKRDPFEPLSQSTYTPAVVPAVSAQPASSPVTQAAFDFDDELDIEEID